MMTAFAEEFDAIFAGAPLMAILRGMGVERSVAVAETAWNLGIDAVEIPLQTEEDARALEAVAESAGARGKIVGAGTIISAHQIVRAQELGARYLVSPGFDASLVRVAVKSGIWLFPRRHDTQRGAGGRGGGIALAQGLPRRAGSV